VWEVIRRKKKVKYEKAYKSEEKRPEDTDAVLKKG